MRQIMDIGKPCLYGACSIKNVQDAREACENLIEAMYSNCSPEEATYSNRF